MLSELSKQFRNLRLSSTNVEIMDKYRDFDEMPKDEIKKIIFNEIATNASNSNASLKKRTSYLFTISDLIEELTPKEFSQIIPIDKEFDGAKFEMRDYFTTIEFIENIGWNHKIPNGFEFLMNYWNQDVIMYAVNLMTTISDYQQRQTGKSIMQTFLEDQGVI